jgi:ribonuclease Z
MVKIFCQILGTKTLDSDPSLLLFFDNKRYLFNSGEGTMRFCTEHKVRLSKIEQIFLTELTPESIGGLAGLLLTMADIHNSDPSLSNHLTHIDLFGPPNLLFYISALRWFIKRRELLLSVHEAFDEVKPKKYIFEDENIRVEAVIASNGLKKKEDDIFTNKNTHFLGSFTKMDYFSQSNQSESVCKRQKFDMTLLTYRGKLNIIVDNEALQSRYKLKDNNLENLFPLDQDFCVSYICHTPVLPGKFQTKKAKDLGIKPGPLYGQLSRGESVVLEDGRVITSDQVLGPSRPGPIVAIVTCPSLLYLNSLVSNEKWKAYFGNHAKQNISVMFHLASENIVNDQRYIDFIHQFGKDCQHVMINAKDSTDRCVFISSAILQCKLNLIDDEMFNIPRTEPYSSLSNIEESPRYDHVKPVERLINRLGKSYKVWNSENLMKFTLEPQAQFGIDKNSPFIPFLDPSAIQKHFSEENHPKFNELIGYYKRSKEQILSKLSTNADNEHERILLNMKNSDMEIVFLGTGAALPSKYRNVSAIMLNSSEDGAILMDCGEGTLGQLYRVYGKDEGNYIILKKIKCIWLSHMHADHHLGLGKLLYRRYQLLMEESKPEDVNRVVIVGPLLLSQFLLEYERCCIETRTKLKFRDIYEFVLINDLQDGMHSNKIITDYMYNNSEASVHLTKLYNIAVEHSCRNSYALILEYNNKLKIVYSGDTRPCAQLIEAGKGATVLIHEATFEDTLQEEAVKKKHSTTKEAVLIGMKMNSYRILLSHFSQRYPKVPVFDDKDMMGNLSINNRTGIAFDLMRLRIAKLPYLPAVIPCVQELFAEELTQQKREE